MTAQSPSQPVPQQREWTREEIEMLLGRIIKYAIIIFLAFITIFPFYWMLNLSLRPEGDILTNPTKLVPSLEDVQTTLHPVGCWLRYGTDDPEVNPQLPPECDNVFGQSSYTIVLVQQGFPPFILNSLLLAVLTVSLTLLLAIPAAYAITRLQFGGRNVMSAGILLIYMFPAIVLAIPLFVVFTRTGLRGTLEGLVLVYMSGTLPVALYMLRSYFMTIPKDLEEAALIDGCTYLSTIWRITIPLATPAIASVALYTFMIAWNEFLYAFLFLVTDRERWTLPLGLERLNDQEVPVSALMAGSLIVSIPIIVISVFLISLLESLFILPAHLAHQRKRTAREKERGLQVWFSGVLKWVIQRTYRPSLLTALKLRYLTMATAIAMLLITFGLVAGGRIKFTFLPKVDADEVIANAALTFGSPVADTRAVSQRLVETAMAVIEEVGGQDISRGVLTNLGQFPPGGGPNPGPGAVGGHLTSVSVFLVPANQRDFTASQFAAKWRDKLTDITGLESLNMRYSTGPSGGASIDIELQHSDIAVLETAAAELAEELKQYAGVKDIDDGFSQGKPQFDLAVKPEARVHGVTAAEMGRQLRDAFYGSRAFRQQRGREEIWIMIRLPENERQSEADIDNFLVRTPGGGEIPLAEAAVIERNRAYTEIRRRNGRRVVDVTADVENQIANANEVLAEVEAKILPDLLERHPGLAYGFSGERESQRESLSALAFGYIFAMMAIFALLAIPFRSYIQPLVVMTSIPFGMIGAILGHIVMGYDLSLISLMGIIALSGVVVNDSLVMIHTANENRKAGNSAMEGILTAGLRRFRPILLTSLTTFFGLAPMILETSVQARFLIPMAISLGFGILFSTFIILLLTPALYMIVEDIRRLFGFKELDEDPLADADPQTQPAGA